jgi:hypothetical protein
MWPFSLTYWPRGERNPWLLAKGRGQVLLFDFHSLDNDVLNDLGVGTTTLQVVEEEAGEVGVHTLMGG